jgi:undecaprenyl-diphosphatase
MPQSSPSASQRPSAQIAIVAIVGFAAALVLPWLIVGAANALPDKTAIVVFDDRVATWLSQNGTDTTDLSFRIVSLFGGWLLAVVMVVATARFALRKQFTKMGTLLVAAAGAAHLNLVLAFTFRRAHSSTATDFESVAQGVNFPSGHSMLALVVYGMLLYFALASARLSTVRKVASTAAVVVLVALIGFARIYLGVHSVSDVLLGFGAGIVWLAACIAGYRRVASFPRTTTTAHPAALQATPL